MGRARAYIEFLNLEMKASSNRDAALEEIEGRISEILERLYEIDARSIIAELPTKDVLIGQFVGMLVVPHRQLMTVINGVGTKMVRVINAIKDTQS